jgi:outer membrane protein insertion porin family
MRLSFTISGVASTIDLSYTEPYFLDRDLSAGFDLFRTVKENSESSFDLERIGGTVRAGYNYQENLRQVWNYTLMQEKVTNVDNNASALVKDDEGTDLESSIGQTLRWDTRDKRFDAREGHVLRLGATVAGLGGDVRFLRTTLGGAYHQPILEDVTGTIASEVGNVIGLDYDTRVSDRFFIGGTSLRGFDTAGVGPRDRLTGDSLGGKHFYTTTLELSFPVGLPPELNFRGRLFSDVGAAWSIDGSDADVEDSSSPRMSVGTGFSWISPFGPVVVDLGWAIVKEDFDNTQLVNFSFGTRF